MKQTQNFDIFISIFLNCAPSSLGQFQTFGASSIALAAYSSCFISKVILFAFVKI